MPFKFNSRKRSLTLFWMGVFALILHAVAGFSLARGIAAAGDVIEICTAQGLVRIDASALPGTSPSSPHAPAGHHTGCCDLCGACSAPLIGVAASWVVHNLTLTSFDAQEPQSEAPRPFPHPALTPLVLRGPPSVA